MKQVLAALRGVRVDRSALGFVRRLMRIERALRELRELGHDDLAGQLEFYEHGVISARNKFRPVRHD